MPRDFYPRREEEILGWTTTFRNNILARGEEVGLTLSQIESYAQTQQEYVEALRRCEQPLTRTPPALARKREVKLRLEAETRLLARIIRACPTLTGDVRVGFGLGLPSVKASRIGRPTTAPALFVMERDGRRITLNIVDSESRGRAKPRGVVAAAVFSCTGRDPATDPAQWTHRCNATRSRVLIHFPASVAPGTQVWLVARWLNPRQECGPQSKPVCTYIEFGGSMIWSNLTKVA
jgi:hypothetical protein